METKKLKVPVDDLDVGMYVARLDRPWLETPFLFQGFRIQDENDISQLKKHCHYVYLDIERGNAPALSGALPIADTGPAVAAPPLVPADKQTHYEDVVPIEKELAVATAVRGKAMAVAHSLLEDLKAGKPLNLPVVQAATESMVDSVVRNPDAFLWLNRLKEKDSYTYHHSLNASVWAVVLGRHIGLPKDDLCKLALGGLLFDIGKTKLPRDLLAKPGRLTPEEFNLIKRHVDYGVEILKRSKDMDRRVLALVRTHHERHDGSGYPNGLQGLQIPLFGRIAAIVDCYDAITTDRPYADSLSDYDAIRAVYEWRGIDFQPELVEQFIQAIGIFPTGSLVELSTGQVAAVIAQNRVRRLRPKVMLILDENKDMLGHFPIVDLIKETVDGNGQPLEILRGLQPGAYGIDPKELFL